MSPKSSSNDKKSPNPTPPAEPPKNPFTKTRYVLNRLIPRDVHFENDKSNKRPLPIDRKDTLSESEKSVAKTEE